MANKTLRIGIIGRHFGNNVHAPAFQQHPDCQLAGVASRDWRALVQDPSVDAVSIAVPPPVQRQIALSILELKKHVLFEKPLTGDFGIAQILAEKAKEAKVVAMVNFELPFMKTWIEAKRLIDKGHVGRLSNVDITWTAMSYSRGEFDASWKFNPLEGGGLLNNFGCHVFNYVEHFFGRIIAMTCEQELVTHGNNIKLDVGVTLNLKTKMGLPISVKMDGRGPKPLHRIHITGTNGSLTLENTASDYISGFVLKKDGAVVANEKQALLNDDGRIWATHQVVKCFVDSIKTGKLNSPTLTDGVRAEELMKWALQSSRTRQEIAI